MTMKKITFKGLFCTQSCLMVIIFFGANAHSFADASYTTATSQLHIPFIKYQGQYFQAHLNYLPPDKLKLEQVNPQISELDLPAIVPVNDDLNFHLERISIDNQLFSADLEYLNDNTFKISNLNPSLLAEPSKTMFQSDHFIGSGICAQCHDGIQDEEGADVSIASAWSSSMMANATRDPFWQAKVRSELNRTPELSDEINDKCTRCHAPMANEEARKQHDNVQTVFDGGILSSANPYHDLAMNGVSCSLCHQISLADPFGTETGFSGNFSVESYENGQNRLIYGPYENVLTRPMQNFTNFTPVFSEHIKSSELCASCHDLTTPYSDENGVILSQNKEDEFPEQMVYSEWLHSDFAETDSCQQCHMPRSDGVVIAAQPRTLSTKRDDFAQHSFLGSNRLMLSILDIYKDTLGITVKDFSTSITNAEKLLQSAAKIEINTPTLSAETLDFNVIVSSETGHKLPSGYPSRRVILHVTIKDEADTIVFESGKIHEDGSVEGLNSDLNRSDYEPHYQLINSPDQVQVYEVIMQDYKENITYTLLRAKSYLKDNRLLPKGFDKQIAGKNIQVRGVAAIDNNFIGGQDSIHFSIGGLSGNGYQIEAELVYQTLGYAFAQDLFQDNSLETGRFKQMFNASALKSTRITATQRNVN